MKHYKNYFVIFFCFFLLVLWTSESSATRKGARKQYAVSAKSAILFNATKNMRLYGKNIDEKVLPASTAKVMTAIIVFENLPLDKMVVVSARATGVAPSKAGLIAGNETSAKTAGVAPGALAARTRRQELHGTGGERGSDRALAGDEFYLKGSVPGAERGDVGGRDHKMISARAKARRRRKAP